MAASVTQTLPLPGLASVATVNSPEGPPAQPIITVQPEPTAVMESNGGITATGSGAEYFYYSLFIGPTGAPFASNHPDSQELPSTSSFVINEVPQPRLVKNFLEFIGARENIHPSRLWFSSLRGNEKQKMAPTSGGLRGLPSTAQVPPSPDATNAVIITIYLSRPFRREDARTSPPSVFLCGRTILDTTRRAEHGCEAVLGSRVYNCCCAFVECCPAVCLMVLCGAMSTAAANRVPVYSQGPDGQTYVYYN